MERSNAHLQQQLGKKDEHVTVSPNTTMDTLPLVPPPPSRETLRETLPAAPAAPDDPVRRPTRRHRWLLWPLLAAVVAALPLLPVEVWLPHMDLPSDDLSSTADPLLPLSPADVPSFLNATCLDSERRFPLVVKPADPSVSIERVSEWVERNRDIVTGWLEAYGAVLLRGFAVEEAAQFERVAMAYTDRLDNIYLGTSPRESVTNSQFVFTASEFESWKVVPMHCEMSFLPRPPEHLFFFAKEMPPDMVGGESPLVDMRAVAREMGEATRAAFERKGIRYVRAYPSARSSHPLDKYDPFKTKSYEAMFRHVPSAATDAAAVEAESRRQGFTPSWGARRPLPLAALPRATVSATAVSTATLPAPAIYPATLAATAIPAAISAAAAAIPAAAIPATATAIATAQPHITTTAQPPRADSRDATPCLFTRAACEQARAGSSS